MGMTDFWISPMLLLPGVGLMIMSTSARYTRVHDELDSLMHDHTGAKLATHLFGRARLLRNALVLLYTSALILGLGALAGGFSLIATGPANATVLGSIALAVACLCGAAATLVLESWRSLEIIRAHLEEHQRH